jgi:hypothetical protein
VIWCSACWTYHNAKWRSLSNLENPGFSNFEGDLISTQWFLCAMASYRSLTGFSVKQVVKSVLDAGWDWDDFVAAVRRSANDLRGPPALPEWH